MAIKTRSKMVTNSAWFNYFSLKAKLGQEAQGGPPEEVVVKDQEDREIVPSMPALPAAPGPPQARGVRPPG